MSETLETFVPPAGPWPPASGLCTPPSLPRQTPAKTSGSRPPLLDQLYIEFSSPNNYHDSP